MVWYSITGENQYGKFKLYRQTKERALLKANSLRKVKGTKNVRIHKLKSSPMK